MWVLVGWSTVSRACNLSPCHYGRPNADEGYVEMGTTTNCDGGKKFLRIDQILLDICRGILQDGESFNTTHSKGPTLLLDRTMWSVLWGNEEVVDHDSSVDHPIYDQDVWSVLWCIVSRSRVFVNVREEVSSICFSTVEDSRKELSHPRSRVGCRGVCS